MCLGMEVFFLFLTELNVKFKPKHFILWSVKFALYNVFCFLAELTVRFDQTTLTVNEEDVGEVTVTVSMIGNTNVPITVDVVFSGTANEAEGNKSYTATFCFHCLVTEWLTFSRFCLG